MPSALSSVPDPVLAALEAATTPGDVRSIMANYPPDRVKNAWSQLDRLTKSSLLFARFFNGIIVGEPEPVRGEQTALGGTEDLKQLEASRCPTT